MDSRVVHESPSFHFAGGECREQIVWDRTSRNVVLQVADKRIFGYDAVEMRALADSELPAVQFLLFEELGFEKTLQQGR